MIKIGVSDGDKSETTKEFLRKLCAGAPIEICEPHHPLDVLIINSIPENHCRALCSSPKVIVANSDDRHVLELISTISAQIITYGFNPKAAITASSRFDDAFVICIQRAMTTICGKAIFPREFAVAFDGRGNFDECFLGAASAALICGVKFE